MALTIEQRAKRAGLKITPIGFYGNKARDTCLLDRRKLSLFAWEEPSDVSEPKRANYKCGYCFRIYNLPPQPSDLASHRKMLYSPIIV